MKTRNNILLAIFTLIFVLLITIGVSFAYFTANMSGGDTETTIEVKGGKMLITYDGGDAITINNILPDDNTAAIKTFTVTGFNNTEIYMGYKLSLVVESNTFSDEALKYKLISTNTDANGEVVPSIDELTNIPSGSSTIILGTGSFDVPTDENKTHTYDLEIYFPNQNYNQNEEQQKQIKAYVKTENYIDPCPSGDCLNNHIISLADNSTETGVYNENGYRYEGLDPNNYVLFNNETWRIIGVFDDYTHGIAGENLVKIIKADSIGDYAWDTKETYGVNDWNTSSLKAYLNSDYYNSLNQVSQSLIENVTWKLGGYADYNTTTSSLAYTAERGTTVYSGRDTTGTGYIGLMYPSDYGYAVLNTSCSRDTTLSSYYKDGCKYQNWLYLGSYEWTITPHSSASYNVWYVYYYGYVSDYYADYGFGGRPSLYLKSNTTIISGDGSLDNPYVLAG